MSTIPPAWAIQAAQKINSHNPASVHIADAKIIAAHAPKNSSLLTSIDETNSKLLDAITLALAEINAGRCIEAGITLNMALQEHKQRLVELPREEHS